MIRMTVKKGEYVKGILSVLLRNSSEKKAFVDFSSSVIEYCERIRENRMVPRFPEDSQRAINEHYYLIKILKNMDKKREELLETVPALEKDMGLIFYMLKNNLLDDYIKSHLESKSEGIYIKRRNNLYLVEKGGGIIMKIYNVMSCPLNGNGHFSNIEYARRVIELTVKSEDDLLTLKKFITAVDAYKNSLINNQNACLTDFEKLDIEIESQLKILGKLKSMSYHRDLVIKHIPDLEKDIKLIYDLCLQGYLVEYIDYEATHIKR